MTFDTLFEQRTLVGKKLKDCIRSLGFTKVFFSEKAGISRPTLDRLLDGTIDNKSTFDRHLQKILNVLNMTADQLLSYSPITEVKKVEAVYSLNAPDDYKMNEKAKKQYGLLMDVLDLCTIYY
ncbi:MAG: helix-turn-helix transcriptional regulator [Lachnospiraceae bacterium]|nr:helix-turn-helix transcriptional regulator [Lachnospiraceae bacterium]